MLAFKLSRCVKKRLIFMFLRFSLAKSSLSLNENKVSVIFIRLSLKVFVISGYNKNKKNIHIKLN